MRRPGWLLAGNATGFAVPTRFAGPPLRCGPSGDTANPAAKRLTTTGRVLPVVIDRLFDYDAPDVPAMSLTSCRSGGKLRSPRIPNQSELIGVHLNPNGLSMTLDGTRRNKDAERV